MGIISPHRHRFSLLFFLLTYLRLVLAQHLVVAGQTITSAPSGDACAQRAKNFVHIRRQDLGTTDCSYGICAGTCLDQGAFCCNPGGSIFSPLWICDNGSCITSIRGATGVVDCYDPDNPSGTTQSCIDFKPTAKCATTDRCYTCSSDSPYCHWQTWVQPSSPTLRWFECNPTSLHDSTYLAATITAAPSNKSSSMLPSSKSTTSSASPSSSLTPPTSSPTSTSITTSSSSSAVAPAAMQSPILSAGAISGIAVGGFVLLLCCSTLLTYFLIRRRRFSSNSNEPNSREPLGRFDNPYLGPSMTHSSPVAELSITDNYPHSPSSSLATGTGSGMGSATVTGVEGGDGNYWRFHQGQGQSHIYSYPNLAAGADVYAYNPKMMVQTYNPKTRMPTELPANTPKLTPRGVTPPAMIMEREREIGTAE